MAVVIFSFGWGLFLHVWLVSVCFSAATPAAQATVSCAAAASKHRGVCSYTGERR